MCFLTVESVVYKKTLQYLEKVVWYMWKKNENETKHRKIRNSKETTKKKKCGMLKSGCMCGGGHSVAKLH